MLAYDYPILGVFWSMLYFFLLFIWILLLFRVFGDIFRSHDMGGFAKALWTIFVIFLPFLGVFVYLIARGDNMAQHAVEQAQQQDAQMKAYVREAAGTGGGGVASEIARLAELKDQGVLTQAEFDAQKAKALG